MAVNFEDALVVGISSRALFDLEEENELFKTKGIDAYRAYQKESENEVLQPGTGFHLVEALLNLNRLAPDDKRLVEVIVMSRNSPETAVRVLHSIESYGLDIPRMAFTGGEALSDYIEAFQVDLFLSKDEEDVQNITDSGVAAAALIYDPPQDFIPEKSTVRIAFDADAVIFSDESEHIYKTQGLEAFHKNEKDNKLTPLKEGPYARLLKTLSHIQHRMNTGVELSPLRLAIVTARSSPAHLRVIQTLRDWNVYVDEAFFLGGMPKDKVLKAFKAHIFFDDQETHLTEARKVVPSGKVPYKKGSSMQQWEAMTKNK
jgi:5'-nucleotidase